MDYAEIHPKNEAIPIDDEIVQDGYDDKVAEGEPRDLKLLDQTKNAPYMFNIQSLKQNAIGSYVPIWKELQLASFATLHEWLKRKKMEINKWNVNKNSVATHVTMNNGRFCISQKDEEDFLKWYSISLLQSKRLWFVEQLTPIFRYFVDLDFAQLVGIPERYIEATAFIVQGAIRQFYASEQNSNVLKVIVCSTNYKYVNAKNDKPEMVKTGIHMLWPNIFLNRDDALDIRETILVELEKAFGKRVHPNNTWQDVVDCSVYGTGNNGTKGSGLRMIGSRKTDPCGQCKGKKVSRSPSGRDLPCSLCLGNGRVDTGRPYFPLCVLDGNGKRCVLLEEEYRTNMIKLVTDTKVRTYFQEKPSEPVFLIPDHAPRNIYQPTVQRGRISKATKQASEGILKPSDPKLNKSTKVELSNTCIEWDVIEKLIRSIKVYSKIVISKITTGALSNQYIVHATGEMCRYCMNISREHVSNRIYFVIDAHGIIQRCHDNADTITEEMKFGLCKNYEGNLGCIPESMVGKLFPNCAAAKTLVAAEEDDDENESNDFKITKDNKLRRLYEIGDSLSQELFKVSWSGTIITSQGGHIIARQRAKSASILAAKTALVLGDIKYISGAEQYAIDPAALGSRSTIAMKEMGFDFALEEKQEDQFITKTQSLSKLETKLFKMLDFAVEIAAFMDPEQVSLGLSRAGFDGLMTQKFFKRNEAASMVNDLTDTFMGELA